MTDGKSALSTLEITKVTHGDSRLKFEREGNVYWVTFGKEIPKGVKDKVEILVAEQGPRV